MAIPKKVAARIKPGLRKFRKILEEARTADRSEQDTVTIVTDMLAEIFGYDKYEELTGEYARLARVQSVVELLKSMRSLFAYRIRGAIVTKVTGQLVRS